MNHNIKLAPLQEISLSKHPQIKESLIQKLIADDPSILGLGDLILKDKERIQPRAGRLDLLLQDPETLKRYTVEIQLGKTDEAHLIRTIEYFDIERKRYPQYEHCAVIIAEDLTSRFFNVINILNGCIPLIALQMKAYKSGDDVGISFNKILGEVNYGLVDEDEQVQEVVDKEYWVKRSSTDVMKLTEECLSIIKSIIPDSGFKYNKSYIGLTGDAYTNNFLIIGPRKKHFIFSIKMGKNEEMKKNIEDAGLVIKEYNRNGRYCIFIQKSDLKDNRDLIENLVRTSWEENK